MLDGRRIRTCQIADGVDAHTGQLLQPHRTDAPHEADREGVEEGSFLSRLDHHQTVRFGHLRGHLRQVLRPRGSDRDRQADLGPYPFADPGTDHGGRTEQVGRPGYVKECLVDRDPLDRGCELVKHLHDGIGQALVLVEVAPDESQGRAQLPGPPAGHPAGHPAALGLIRSSQHDATAVTAPDGYRLAQQCRVQQLLGRGVEGIEIRVEHGRPVSH